MDKLIMSIETPAQVPRLTQHSATLIEIGGHNGINFTHIFQYLGDSRLSFVCKAIQRVSDQAMASLIRILINKGVCSELRLLRDIRSQEVGEFKSPRSYIDGVKLALGTGLSTREKQVIKDLWIIFRHIINQGKPPKKEINKKLL